MSLKFERLISLLRDLFQLDQPDLDFGLYKIMHAKSAEVTQFLEKDLLPQVRKAFEQYQPADKAEREKELKDLVAGIQKAGMSPDDSPEVRRRRAELASAIDIGALEDEVFDHLHSFFRRYYSEGDFLSKRVYKPGVYAVPYEGEEVVLHWANKDQYYIKTSEYLRDYAFRLRPDFETNPMRVHFRLADAAEGEHGNIKAAEGKDRVFILAPAGDSGHDFVQIEKVNGQDELVIRFVYRPASPDDWTDDAKRSATAAAADRPPTQKALSTIATKAILGVRDRTFTPWVAELEKAHTKVNGEKADYSRLEGHLARYAARHTFDYFIHKDLGGFLRRELDFYIKNEVMHLDDIEAESVPKVEQYLSKIKIIRAVAGKIIAFIAQLEAFQKRLWLKKRFVVATHYCISLDRIPRTFYRDIAANERQRMEWERLFDISTIQADLAGQVAYSSPLTEAFLDANPTLPIDTSLFDRSFEAALLEAIGDVAAQHTATLVHGDNADALRLLTPSLRNRVDLAYIDPPYNTGTDGFVYKDAYQHSSWLCLLCDRLSLLAPLMHPNGTLACSLDDNETYRLGVAIGELASTFTRLGEFVWRTRNTDNRVTSRLSVDHEYVHVFARPGASIEGRVIDRSSFKNPDNDLRGPYTTDPLTGKANATDRPNLHYMIINPDTGEEYPPDPDFGWITDKPGFDALLADKRVKWPANPKTGTPRKKRFLSETDARAPVSSLEIKIKQGEGNNDLIRLFGEKLLNFPKPVSVMQTVIDVCTPSDGLVLDFFAGSGTTGEALLRLRQSRGDDLRLVLVEAGEHFRSLLKPRILKVVGRSEWDAGKPTSHAGLGKALVKCIALESYEDTITNLAVQRSAQVSALLAAKGVMAEQYLLQYMLDSETRGSSSLLSIQEFKDPTAYTLRVKHPGTDESSAVAVDLLETFNCLIGLTANHLNAPQTFSATFHRDGEDRLCLKGTRTGRLKPDPTGPWWFRTVTGTTADGKRVLVIWRKRPGGDTPDGIEQDNLVLDEWFRKQGYSASDAEFDLIYVNGDNNLGNLRQEDESQEGLTETGWKVRVIEEDFHRLMFDMEGA